MPCCPAWAWGGCHRPWRGSQAPCLPPASVSTCSGTGGLAFPPGPLAPGSLSSLPFLLPTPPCLSGKNPQTSEEGSGGVVEGEAIPPIPRGGSPYPRQATWAPGSDRDIVMGSLRPLRSSPPILAPTGSRALQLWAGRAGDRVTRTPFTQLQPTLVPCLTPSLPGWAVTLQLQDGETEAKRVSDSKEVTVTVGEAIADPPTDPSRCHSPQGSPLCSGVCGGEAAASPYGAGTQWSHSGLRMGDAPPGFATMWTLISSSASSPQFPHYHQGP